MNNRKKLEINRSSFIVKLARIFQYIPLKIFRFLEYPFIVFFLKNKNTTPALFILALPRSGSTVTYQSICHGLKVNYLSNLWNLLYQIPFIGGYFSSKKAFSHYSSFKSNKGFVEGKDGPSEGLKFWSFWLNCGLRDSDCMILKPNKLKKRSMYLQKSLIALSNLNNSIFVSSYLGHTLVPDRLSCAFPGAVMIRLKRSPIENALSILQCMREDNLDWFSVVPHESEGLSGLCEYKRVASQVYWLNRRLDDSDCASLMLNINYEDLCRNPNKEISRIHKWCIKKGIKTELKFKLPEFHNVKKANLILDEDALKIKKELELLESIYGPLKK